MKPHDNISQTVESFHKRAFSQAPNILVDTPLLCDKKGDVIEGNGMEREVLTGHCYDIFLLEIQPLMSMSILLFKEGP